jgi:hypothetical protein
MIEVEVEGETKNGVPHGQCFIYFIYNNKSDEENDGDENEENDNKSKNLKKEKDYRDG